MLGPFVMNGQNSSEIDNDKNVITLVHVTVRISELIKITAAHICLSLFILFNIV